MKPLYRIRQPRGSVVTPDEVRALSVLHAQHHEDGILLLCDDGEYYMLAPEVRPWPWRDHEFEIKGMGPSRREVEGPVVFKEEPRSFTVDTRYGSGGMDLSATYFVAPHVWLTWHWYVGTRTAVPALPPLVLTRRRERRAVNAA